MDRLTYLTSLTRQTPCPECGRKRLEFLLRCDLEYGACLTTAHCRECDMSFEIVATPGNPDPAALKGAVDPCPRCDGRERRASLHCELETRACVYTLECATCGVAVAPARA